MPNIRSTFPRILQSKQLLTDLPSPPVTLRHSLSYEDVEAAQRRHEPPVYQRQSPNPLTSTHYQRLQQQYEPNDRDQGGLIPPCLSGSETHQNRDSRQTQPPHAPYRILHSYNSPAYRHVPIWG
jgi:hypothetical protein